VNEEAIASVGSRGRENNNILRLILILSCKYEMIQKGEYKNSAVDCEIFSAVHHN
jgi:hypothetical protein